MALAGRYPAQSAVASLRISLAAMIAMPFVHVPEQPAGGAAGLTAWSNRSERPVGVLNQAVGIRRPPVGLLVDGVWFDQWYDTKSAALAAARRRARLDIYAVSRVGSWREVAVSGSADAAALDRRDPALRTAFDSPIVDRLYLDRPRHVSAAQRYARRMRWPKRTMGLREVTG